MEELINESWEDEVELHDKDAQHIQNPALYNKIINNLSKKIDYGNFHLYGSRMMGVANEESDLDIYIEMGEKSRFIHVQLKSLNLVCRKFLLQRIGSEHGWKLHSIFGSKNATR